MAGLITTPPPGGTTPDPNEPLDPNKVMAPSMDELATQDVQYTAPPAPEAPKPRDIATKETVSGQLNDLLSQDSKYMQSANANANEKMNSRGLINSSMAVGASQKAAIDSALPIATSDANIYANAGQAAQQAGHQLQQTGYQGDINAALQTQQGTEQRKTAGQQGLIQTTLNDQTIAANKTLQDENNAFNRTLQIDLKEMGLAAEYEKMDADARKQFVDTTGTVTQQWMDYQKTIRIDKNLTPEAAAEALRVGEKSYKDHINLAMAVTGLKDSTGKPMTWDTGDGAAPTTPTTPTTPITAVAGGDFRQVVDPTRLINLSSDQRKAAVDAGMVFDYSSGEWRSPAGLTQSYWDPASGGIVEPQHVNPMDGLYN